MFGESGRFIRRKTVFCDKEKRDLEIELFPMCDFPRARGRRKRYRETCPVQRSLNDRRARRFFRRLVKGNFGRGDFSVTLTYRKGFCPADADGGMGMVQRFLRRLRFAARKAGRVLRYIAVTEQMQNGNVHHHVLLNGDCGVDRDAVERAWHVVRRKGMAAESLGLVNCRRIQMDRDTGVEGLAQYLAKDPKGRRRWLGSRNLWRPRVSVSDTAVSRKEFREICLFDEESGRAYAFFEKCYPGYRCLSFVKEFNAESNLWYVRVVLHRKEPPDGEQGCAARGDAPVWAEGSD